MDNLAKRGMKKQGKDMMCVLCGNQIETIEHLLFLYKKAWKAMRARKSKLPHRRWIGKFWSSM